MGEIFKVSCENCEFEKELMTGAGMMSIRAEVVEQNLQGEDLAVWQELHEKKNARFFSWRYELAYCNTCKELQSCFVVDIHTNDGNTICLGSRCSVCQKKLDLILQDTDMLCPVCGQTKVSKKITGRWD